MNGHHKFVIILIYLCFAFVQAGAQVNQIDFIRGTTIRPGFHIKYWDYEEGAAYDRFVEAAFPTTYSMALGKRLSVDFVTSPFITALEENSGKAIDYSNMSDSYARASLILGDNLALLTLGVGIPTGETELEGREPILANIAANRPLKNPVTTFGTGTNFNFGLAFAQPFGEWVLGLGVGYAIRSEYDIQPGDQELMFDPGDELNLTLGVEREFDFLNNQARFTGDIIYTNYSEDDFPENFEFESEPFLYEAGDKILLSGRVIAPIGVINPLILSVLNRWRLENKTNNPLLEENGSEFEFSAIGISNLSSLFGLKYLYRTQVYGDNDQGTDGALIHGFGGGFILSLGRHFTFDPTFIYSTGTVNTGEDEDVSLTGLELTGGFTLRF